MATHPPIELSIAELRGVSAFALRCAERVLPLFAEAFPDDERPALAILAGHRFADGGTRDTALRKAAMDAWRAGTAAKDEPRASHAGFSASMAASAAFLHPYAEAHQVRHILGAGGHAVAALELDGAVVDESIDWVASLADADAPEFVTAMAAAGFVRAEGDWHDNGKDGTSWPKRFHGSCDPGRVAHVHVREVGSPGWSWALMFRDWLRADQQARDSYGVHKRALAAEHPVRRDYAEAKEPWFHAVAGPAMERWAVATGWAEPA